MERVVWRRLALRKGYVCSSCVARRTPSRTASKRRFHASPLRRQGVLEVLEERGLVNQIAGSREQLSNILANRKVSIYAGVDPTAPSLHIGHLLPLMVLFWLHNYGHDVVSLVGGGTSKIGDPSGRLTSRASVGAKEQGSNLRRMWSQTERLWEKAQTYGNRHGYKNPGKIKVMDNISWLGRTNILNFLNILGTGMRVGTMLGRDTVRNKMEQGDGMSFAEFAYPLLQGWDWWHMYKTFGVQVQVGGADQYGNIIAGLDAVRYIAQNEGVGVLEDAEGSKEPMGLTVPLLTTSKGEKFGKSAGNALWLNSSMTSAFDLYGFLLKTADADVERYLKLFTFVPLNAIRDVMNEHAVDPSLRKAQHLLASEVLELVHGLEVAQTTKQQHQQMRRPTLGAVMRQGGQPRKAAPEEGFAETAVTPEARAEAGSREQTQQSSKPEKARKPKQPQREREPEESLEPEEPAGLGEQHVILSESKVHGQPFPSILQNASLASSLSEAKRMITAGGVYVAQRVQEEGSQELDFVPVKSLTEDVKVEDLLIEGRLVLRLGKWKVRVVEVVDESVFDCDMLRV